MAIIQRRKVRGGELSLPSKFDLTLIARIYLGIYRRATQRCRPTSHLPVLITMRQRLPVIIQLQVFDDCLRQFPTLTDQCDEDGGRR